jgi:hypothetical protein
MLGVYCNDADFHPLRLVFVNGKLGCSRIGSVLCVPLQLRLMTDGVLSLSDCRSDSYHCYYNDYGNRRPIGGKHDREQYYPTR